MTAEYNLLSTVEAAKIVGLSDSRVRQLILSNRLPAVKLGKFNYIRREDLQKIENCKRGRPKKERKS